MFLLLVCFFDFFAFNFFKGGRFWNIRFRNKHCENLRDTNREKGTPAHIALSVLYTVCIHVVGIVACLVSCYIQINTLYIN